ncbi:DUF6406 domain-containing protein [Actinorugispora endophytica]|uniref:Uncharacterized protein n=1 Tax=Actinorugispora endophytica TaxID=1605990 RepID=A0A4R6V0M1_9ACTN|nr:DUF6406 domain-containing protein [Actinorugispora endophytica]TDQ52153.1 hypothetical protein EV190_108135 [Actinorugispora endophytica]
MAHEVGAQEQITYGRNDRFDGGPVGGGGFWVDDEGRPVARLGGPQEWPGLLEVRVGETFTVGGQLWRIDDIVNPEAPSAYLVTTRIG